jgi:uncharacterized protein YbjT (DUF2867 family)
MDGGDLILVTGGTGGLGRRVVPRLLATGRQVRVLSRKPHESTPGAEYVVGDLVKGSGLSAALAGAGVVLHCAGVGKIKEDVAQAANLVRAARAAGVRHVVNISVVGAERVPVRTLVDRAMFAYFASQRGVEEVIENSGLPWTNLRATQFHDGFILVMVHAMSKLPVIPLPAGVRFQPIDADEVADRLVELSLRAPAGQVPDFGGPKIYPAIDLLRSYLAVIGKPKMIVQVGSPGGAARAVRAGANLAPDRAVGRRTWEEFLESWARSPDRAIRPPFEATSVSSSGALN